ncbi:magnesium transporter [Lacipirellula parvula]|uniref:Magnesium transporter MgtE n=1 Tax=Lacipirellula parvula TaxID=2650471 RepID=A0A5K7XEM5_9BACT|nr:magnesium transporter [Lacipirellula parvula]BBO34507.1 transporter MgtE [Lacipirellula parvula]
MIGNLLRPELEELIAAKEWDVLREAFSQFHPAEIAEILEDIPDADDVPIFRVLPRTLAAEVFAHLPQQHQEMLIRSVSSDQMRSLLSDMSPDDQTRLLEELPPEVTKRLLASLSPEELQAARDLLGYPLHSAGRYMTPEYVAIHAGLTAREALDYIRTHGRDKETVNVVFILDEKGKLLADISLGALVMANPDDRVHDIHRGLTISLTANSDREEALRTFEKYGRIALPVTDCDGHMLGIITIDDILDVASREATEDMQKIGGMEALDAPYLDVSYLKMIRKRGGWLSVLFLGEMLTATAMGFFEEEIAHAVVLAMFVPLIISSGGNSGSQAATLIVRALALGEVKLKDWWKVLRRELRTSATLGMWLGMVGFARIMLWQKLGWFDYGDHYYLVAATVWLSLIGVVCFGSVAGSMLPFALRKAGFDPATSSAPFVATLVDVTGLVIYFTVALAVLQGTLL